MTCNSGGVGDFNNERGNCERCFPDSFPEKHHRWNDNSSRLDVPSARNFWTTNYQNLMYKPENIRNEHSDTFNRV